MLEFLNCLASLVLVLINRPFNEEILRALPIARVGSFARAKHSIVRASHGTWMCIFDKASVSDMSSARTEVDACLRARARSRTSH